MLLFALAVLSDPCPGYDQSQCAGANECCGWSKYKVCQSCPEVGASAKTVLACQPAYSQCGGRGWTGATTCCDGVCHASGEYYSQCLAPQPQPARQPQQQQPQPQQQPPQQAQPQRPAFVDALVAQLPSLPRSVSDLRERWSRAAEDDPRLISLLHFLGAVGIFLACALVTFCRIRLRACLSTRKAIHARNREALSAVELEPMAEAACCCSQGRTLQGGAQPRDDAYHCGGGTSSDGDCPVTAPQKVPRSREQASCTKLLRER